MPGPVARSPGPRARGPGLGPGPLMISEPGRLWGEGKSPKMLQKCSPSPSGWLPPKCSKNASKMVPKWSLDALLTLFILKNNRGAAFGRRPPSGSLLFSHMKSVKSASRDHLGTIFEAFLDHFWSILGEPAGRARGACLNHFCGFPFPPQSGGVWTS